MVTTGDLLAMVNKLAPAGPRARPVRHQGILLLWAVGRARRRLPRLVRWSEAQEPLRLLFEALGREEDQRTPEYPFVRLARTQLWELPDAGAEIPLAHSSVPLSWLKQHNPQGGLPIKVYERLATDSTAREAVVRALLDRFFHDGMAAEALRMTGLDDIDVDTGTTDTSPGHEPAWAWDEVVLARDLVASNEWYELPPENSSVAELSELLRSLPIHPDEVRRPEFRSPHSVHQKMADIISRLPDSTRKQPNGDRLDLEVLTAFLDWPQKMHAYAEQLRSGAEAG
jgi:hypothetical protein